SMPVAGAYVADLAPPDRRGLYMGIYGMVWATSFVFGPTLGTYLFAFNRTLLWAGCGLLGTMAAILILRPITPSRAGCIQARIEPAKLS
ncbi:MAG TPA: MFS transporter, partial [Verrucomicrobiae bacterium]|nr:MFS transporter [Verrucomicrobiae bacterium]